MTLYTAHANLTTVGDDRKTAHGRFDRFMRRFVDEGLITGYSIDEPGDMEQDIDEGVSAIWMSEVKIEFESEHQWPSDGASAEDAKAAIELIRGEMTRIQARIAELLEAQANIEYDYFNHDRLTFEDPEPVE